MSAPSQALSDLFAWIVGEGLATSGQETFLAALAPRLAALVPIERLSIGIPSLDPNVRGASFTWTSDGAIEADFSAYGAEGEALFQTSPIFYARSNELMEISWNLGGGEGVGDLPLLERLASRGFTHYALKLLAFPNEPYVTGMAFSFATRKANGFSAADHAAINALLPAIGLAVYRIELSRIATETLKVYVGPRTSERILAGSVHRGEGHAIRAAILFADLKGFTELSEAHPAVDVVAWLNEHFDALDEPICEHGGEILKFMGDGLLAVFPSSDGIAETRDACAQALQAARHALIMNDVLNRRRVAAGAPAVGLDIALHLGEVFYGNVGAARRLDFTVIGSAVNLASRIEELCDRLDRNLVLSKAFAEQCGVAVIPLGGFALKGIAEPQDVFGLVERTATIHAGSAANPLPDGDDAAHRPRHPS